ncbi:MAG: hypothetical protein AAF541_04130 [Pseudomonadota bacterium]
MYRKIASLAAGAALAVLSLSALSVSNAHADTYRGYNDRDQYNHHGYDRGRYLKQAKHGYARPLSLSFKVRLNGDNRVALRRLIEQRYGIDTQDYVLRSVTVANKSRYGACAELVTGRTSTGPVDLRRGLTTLYGPHHAGGRGKWQLHLEDSRVRRIRVELSPAYQQVGYRHHKRVR